MSIKSKQKTCHSVLRLKIGSHVLFRFILVTITTLFCIISLPVIAKVSTSHIPTLQSSVQQPEPTTQNSENFLKKGRLLYNEGQFEKAIQVLQQAIQIYQNRGDSLNQAIALSNLSLVYQKVGQWDKASQTITESLNLLQTPNAKDEFRVLAQTLNIEGGLLLDLGKTEQALETWKRAESIYIQISDEHGILQSRINQAQAFQVLGFYRRALTLLIDTKQILESKPDSLTKAIGLRSLGNVLRLVGDLEQSHQSLEQSLMVAKRLQSFPDISAALFSLGNTAQSKQDIQAAIDFYRQAATIAPDTPTKIQAQINLLNLLIDKGDKSAAQRMLSEIQSLLNDLIPNQASVYARINLAQVLMKASKQDESGGTTLHSMAISTPQTITKILTTAAQQAKNLQDRRAEAYAIGNLGSVYEQLEKWPISQELTQQALSLVQTIDAPDIVYRWSWQLGRLLKKQGNIQKANAAYDAAVDALQLLRKNLVTANRDIQFSFRESVEPVYRESVELLLQPQSGQSIEANLEKARGRIEALQLAELDNFFREACLNAKTVLLDEFVDQDNPNTAIIYPIILPNQLEVIVKIPKQSLHHYSIDKSQSEINLVIAQLQDKLTEPDALEEVKALSQQVYDWLIRPISSDLQQSQVTTLVFVLDGTLRGIPMAALYDGNQYLIEKYAVALSLGLQLFQPKALATDNLNVLAAGLVQPPPKFEQFSPLPAIKSEFDLISKAGIHTQQLLDEKFTKKNLEANINTFPFNIVHLATHGQFSSQAKETFILAADGPINVTELDSLLRGREQVNSNEIDLLVLSACRTAAGDNRATLGLAGVAIRAGARSTLASLWHINDQSTAIFIGEFYRELASAKVTKAEALRRAQLVLLHKYPNFNRPGYWSPYVLVGNWL